jgi:vesicle-associated membrane protein 7
MRFDPDTDSLEDPLRDPENGNPTDPPKNSKVQVVKDKIHEVKQVMVQNIDKMLDRGERIELLQDKTNDLSNYSSRFQTESRSLRNRECLKNQKLIWMSAGLVTAVLLFIVLIMAANKNQS